MITNVKESIMQYIADHNAKFHELSSFIWENPELGMEEHLASGKLCALLVAEGFSVEKGAAGMPTAFVATFGSGKPVIGFNSEYDALPGLSQQVEAVKKPVHEGWPGHGCGHNLMAVAGIMAAVAIKEAMKKHGFQATLKIFGTPAEELCIGKQIMAKAGLFDDLDLVVDWHPTRWNASNALSCPAYFNIRYHFAGRTAHGNSPWHGRSALDAAILQGQAVEMLREHLPPGKDEVANTINYTFSDTGPEFPSVVPDKATAWYVGRFISSQMMEDAIKRVDKCADAAALATETSVEKEYITATHEMIPNETAAKAGHDNLVAFGIPEFTEGEKLFLYAMQDSIGQERYESSGIKPHAEAWMGVTDSSEYSWFAPLSLLHVYLGPGPGWHNWMVTACSGAPHGVKAVNAAARGMAATAVDFIFDAALLAKAQQEHKQRLNGRSYRPLLPEGTPVPLKINTVAMEKYRK